LCDLLGIELPIVAAPMGASISGPELAAAVSNAGGLGIVSFGANPPPLLRRLVERVRELTDRPFGVNYLLPFTMQEQVDVCVELRVPVLSTFWGDPAPYVGAAHDAGLKVLHQVGSVADARRAVDAGVDAVIAQGAEAGGHVAGGVATMVLVPRVVDAIAPVPVIAAGGIGDARGVVAALSCVGWARASSASCESSPVSSASHNGTTGSDSQRTVVRERRLRCGSDLQPVAQSYMRKEPVDAQVHLGRTRCPQGDDRRGGRQG